MAKSTGVGSIFIMSSFESPAATKKRSNPHTKQYDDDGTVITISLRKFFSGFSEYSKFLNDGSRAYMSLTDEEGYEIFQLSMVDAFHGASADLIEHKVNVKAKLRQRNLGTLIEAISEKSDSPIVMQGSYGHVYGILYPMVRLEKE